MGEGPRARNVRINFRWRVAASGGRWRAAAGRLKVGARFIVHSSCGGRGGATPLRARRSREVVAVSG